MLDRGRPRRPGDRASHRVKGGGTGDAARGHHRDGRGAGLAWPRRGLGPHVRMRPVGKRDGGGEAGPVRLPGQRGRPCPVPEVRVPGRGAAERPLEEVHRLPRRGPHGTVAGRAPPEGRDRLTAGRWQPPHLWRGVIEEYRAWLPVTGATPVVTLREGGTPLVPSEVLSEDTGCEVHLK